MCEHQAFNTTAKITRLADKLDGPATGFLLEVSVNCEQCGLPFVFRGVTRGISGNKPTMSFLGEEVRLPIEPMDEDALSVFKKTQDVVN